MILAAEATAKAAGTLLGLSVMEWILLGTTLAGGIGALLKWLEARASKREAHELALAKVVLEGERDAMIEGVEAAGDQATKDEIAKASKARRVETLGENVRRVTGRLAPVFLVLLMAGCCTVDHDQMVETAEQRIELLDQVADLPDEAFTPEAVKRLAAEELKSWEIQKARLTGKPLEGESVAK